MSNTDPLEWKLLDTDFSTVLGILPSDGGNLYIELNESGSGELKIPLSSAIASVVTAGMFAQCNYRGAARGGFLIDNVAKVNANAQEGGGQWLSLSGRGALAILDEAIIWDDGTGNTKREFTGTKASILIDLIDEAVTRGAIANVEYDFTDTVDSESVSWTDNESLSLPVGTSLLELLRQFADTGIDFDMVVGADGTFTLQAFKNEKGSNLSSTVYFRVGTNCEEVSEEKRGTKIKNVLKMKWRDGFANVQDNTSIAAYRRREEILNIEAAQSASSATTYGAAKLEGLKDPQRSLPIKVYDGVTPYVFVSYNVGDYITIDRFGVQSSERIRGMQFAFNEAGYAVITITLNDTIYENDIDMGRDLDWLMKQWNTARDAKKLEVAYWLPIGDPNQSYSNRGSFFIGDKYYVMDGYILRWYDIVNGGWSSFNIGSSEDVKCSAVVGTDIYIGCLGKLMKYETTTDTLTTVATVTDAINPLIAKISNIAVVGTDVFFSGIFDHIGAYAFSGVAGLQTVSNTWGDLAGVSNPGTPIYSDGNNLYGIISSEVYRWTGATWSQLGTFPTDADDITSNFAIYGTGFLVGTSSGDYLYYWDGSTWAAFEDTSAISGYISSIDVYLTDVYVTGGVSGYVAKFSGGAWWSLAGGLNNGARLLLYQGYDNVDVYCFGLFTEADNKPANQIAVYVNNFEALADYLDNSNSSFNLGEAIHNATAKTPLVAADEMPLWDSISQRLRKITWANILVTIGTWADGLYVKLTGAQTIAGVKTFSSDPIIPDEAYDATAWNGSLEPPTKNAVRDKIESMGGGGGTPGGSDTEVQFNNAGAFDGSPDFRFDESGTTLYLGETTSSSGVPSHGFGFDPTGRASHSLFTWGTAISSYIRGVLARGTKSSPTAVQSGDVFMEYRGAGYDGVTSVGSSPTEAKIAIIASENHDATHHGADVEIHATPAASTTLTKILSILGSGHLNIATGKEYRVNGAQHTHAASDITSGTFDLTMFSFSEISITTTATATIGRMHVCSGTSADYTVALPTAVGNAGKLIGFRMSTALTKLVTLDGNSTQTIDGSLTRIMWAGESCVLISDGSNWFKIYGKSIPMQAGIYQGSAQAQNLPIWQLNLDTSLFTPSVAYMQDTTNKRLYIARPGLYDITMQTTWYNTNTTAHIDETLLYVSGAQDRYQDSYQPASAYLTQLLAVPKNLVAGDYIDLRVSFTAGTFTTNAIYPGAGFTNMSIAERILW